jgi:hypothetical protein
MFKLAACPGAIHPIKGKNLTQSFLTVSANSSLKLMDYTLIPAEDGFARTSCNGTILHQCR